MSNRRTWKITEKEKPRENLASEDDVVFTLPKLQTILENDESEQTQEIKNSKIKD